MLGCLTATYRQNMQCAKNEREKYECEIRARYANIELSGLDVRKIREAEADGAACAECSGFPCRKRSMHGVKPVVKIEGGIVKVRSRICEYARQYSQQSAYSRNFAQAKIPPIYAGKTLADYQIDGANKTAVGWARNTIGTGEGLYVYGEPGTGKTMLAAIIAQELLKAGKTVIFGDVPTLLDALKSTFDGEGRLDELMRTLAEVDALILDDLGTEQPTEWAVERLYKIINERYVTQRTTIVTSNYEPRAVAERLNKPKNGGAGVSGSRIISRLQQMCRIAAIGGVDRRLRRR